MAKMPKTVKEKKMLSLYVKDSDRVALLEQLLEDRPWERSLSDAVFNALSDLSNYGPLLEREAVSIHRLSFLMSGARLALNGEKNEEIRRVVYWHVVQYYVKEHLQSLQKWGHDMWGRDFAKEETAAIGNHFEGPPPFCEAKEEDERARELFMKAVTGSTTMAVWDGKDKMERRG